MAPTTQERCVEIQVKVEIFADPKFPEFCADNQKYCAELYRIDWIFWCHQYRRHGADRTPLEQDEGKFFELPKKCPQCREALEKARQKEEETKKPKCIVCENPFDPENEDNWTKCGTDAPF